MPYLLVKREWTYYNSEPVGTEVIPEDDAEYTERLNALERQGWRFLAMPRSGQGWEVLMHRPEPIGKGAKIVEDCGERLKAALGEAVLDMPALLGRLQHSVMEGERDPDDLLCLTYVHGQYHLTWGTGNDLAEATCSYVDPAPAFRELGEALDTAEGR